MLYSRLTTLIIARRVHNLLPRPSIQGKLRPHPLSWLTWRSDQVRRRKLSRALKGTRCAIATAGRRYATPRLLFSYLYLWAQQRVAIYATNCSPSIMMISSRARSSIKLRGQSVARSDYV